MTAEPGESAIQRGAAGDHRQPHDVPESDLATIERRTLEIGRELFDNLPDDRPHMLQRRWWDEQLMSLTMRDEQLKVQLFRFVDVLPMLHTSEAIVGHLHEYLNQVREHLPSSARVALGVARRTPGVRAAVAKAARLAAMDFARKFIAGTNTREAIDAARRERNLRRGFTLDILGEAVTSDQDADFYYNAYRELLENIAPTVNAWPEVPQIDRGVTGPLPRMNLSIKLSALDSQFDPIDPAGATRRVAVRLRELLRVARRQQAFINIDMESYKTKDLTLAIFKQVLGEEEFRGVGDVGIVIQCYLRDAEQDLTALRDWAAARGKPVWVRLVKGAYWDYETTLARQHDWPIPVYQQKWQSDANFERLTRFVMLNYEHLRPALGSHNLRSIAHAIAVARHVGLPEYGFELQMLYGMADPEKQALVERGLRMRTYMPYGELIPGMGYLVRRLLENTSNDSFLRASFSERIPPDVLLKSPVETGRQELVGSARGNPLDTLHRQPNPQESRPMPATKSPAPAPFRNEPPVDFSKEANRRQMQAALDEVRGQLGKTYPLVIDGQEITTADRIESHNPSQRSQLVGAASSAGVEHVQTAVAAARKALPAWHALGAERRAEYLRAAAAEMRRRRFELAAVQVYECGKPWREATADIDEAIDFCEYYAAGAIALQAPAGVRVPGEDNRFEYLPRGVTAVIAPWNFPLAILTGMTTAALATGNTVVMKPAEQSPVTAALLMQIFRHVGLPAGVLHYLPGVGEVTGQALVDHPQVAVIVFTGSRTVGMAIHARAAEISASAPQVKQVITEMGGKNAIIVDADADLDEAVAGITYSAFGYAGQKCSACSRVIALAPIHDALLTRLVDSTRSLQVGPASDPGTTVGPVIDAESQQRVQRYVAIGREEGREALAVDVGALAEQGYFVGPHIFADISPDARLAQEEVFGPVLAVMRAANLDDALRIANSTDYALTGGIFSRSPAHLEQARRELMVGNLYLNRGTTGALVSRQPFGGFRMSGIGSKAGGPDYLHQFVLPRTVTENTMRRGFVPPEE